MRLPDCERGFRPGVTPMMMGRRWSIHGGWLIVGPVAELGSK